MSSQSPSRAGSAVFAAPVPGIELRRPLDELARVGHLNLPF